MDYISMLYFPLICMILSKLPVKDAVATSILSRQWRNLWRNVSHLDINPVDMMMNRERRTMLTREPFSVSIPLIDLILQSLTGDIVSCRIVHSSRNVQFSQRLIQWIEFLKVEKRIQKLVLSKQEFRWNDIFTFPGGLFRCNTLSTLELENYNLRDTAAFEGCSNLVTLILSWVTIWDGSLNHILLACTSLENLTLRYCRKLKNVEIYKDTLKHLEIDYLSVREFKLRAPNLVALEIDGFSSPRGIIMIECPNIRVLKAHRKPGSRLVHYLSLSKVIDQCCGLLESYGNYPMGNLRELSISYDLNDIKLKLLLRFIFSVNRHLCKLQITNRPTPSEIASLSEEDYISWDDMELFDCVFRKLKIVHIKGFTGKHLQIQFVSYLIMNATKMEELVIQYGGNCSEEEVNAIEGLSLVSRASPNARLMIRPGPSF